MSNKRIRAALLAVFAMSAMGASVLAFAAEDSVSEAIDYRTSVMTVIGWNFKPMGAMVKGKRPYDQAVFARHARDLTTAVSLDLLAGFPEDSDEGDDTAAKAEIWMDWEDFQQKYQDLKKQVAKLAEVTPQADQDKIAQQFSATAKTCKACHKEYKE